MRIIKIPRINAIGRKGPEKAPNLVLEDLRRIYSGFKKLGLEEIHVDNSNVEESEKLIYENSKEEFENLGKGKRILFLGGDHSMSFPIVKAFMEVSFNQRFAFENPTHPPSMEELKIVKSKSHNDNKFLIIFDAHADCMKPMKEPTHEEWLRAVVEQGFKPENIILVGVRKIEKQEQEFLYKNKIKYFGSDSDFEAAADYITERANGKNVYVSVDVDVLEPCVAPGVNCPEPNGLSSKEFFYLLKRIFHIPSVRVLDVVEIVPELDEKYDYRTVKIGAKIVEEFLKNGKKD